VKWNVLVTFPVHQHLNNPKSVFKKPITRSIKLAGSLLGTCTYYIMFAVGIAILSDFLNEGCEMEPPED